MYLKTQFLSHSKYCLLRITTLTLVMVSQVESDHWMCIADEFQLKYVVTIFSCACACEFLLLFYVVLAGYGCLYI